MNHSIIVGAGIIGMTTAYRLMQAGYRVTLIDQSQAGQQSSWAGGGILSPLHPWRYLPQAIRLVEYSLQHYPEFIQAISEGTDIDVEFIRSGALFIDRESIVQGQDWAQKQHIPCKVLHQRQLSYLEPELASHQQAILFSEIHQLRTPRLLKALKQTLLANGVKLKENESVHALRIKDRHVAGVITENGLINASNVILCCGAWTGQLLTHLNLQSVATRPVRGQMLLFDAKRHPLKHLVLDDRYYLIPRQDGLILAGSTMEEVGFHNVITDAARKTLHQAALALMPSLAACEIKHHWAGLRPGSPNGIPTIAQHPQVKGLYVNAGHFRNGLAMALGSANLLVDLMLNKNTSLDPAAYNVFESA